MKRMAIAVALLVGFACLALWPVYAPAQSSEWESYRYAGIHAHLRGDYTVAEPLYQRSLAIAEKVLGPDHPDVAATLDNLALLYDAQERHADAEPLYQRALEIREKALGPYHTDVAQSLENYAALLRETGRATEAAGMEARAKAIRAKHAKENP